MLVKPLLLAASLTVVPGYAKIVRLAIEHTETIGNHQRLSGHAFGELDPKLKLNSIITDLEFAPRNAHGMVEYVATFTILKPADVSKMSGLLIYFVPNRGNINLMRGGLQEDARKRGDVLVASGWQGDLEPAENRETLSVPVAKNPDGSSITGRVSARFSDMAPGTNTLRILRGGVPGTGDPLSLDTAKATLTRRLSEDRAAIPIRATDWAFGDCTQTSFPGNPDPRKICLKGGFDSAFLYELEYTAKDPKVYGIGFAATRDLNSYLRNSDALGGRITAAISQGNSQSGNFLRSFIHLGFNQDENGKTVFDGSNPNIAPRQIALNLRFAAPSGAAAIHEAGSDGVVWWEDYNDDARGLGKAGLLDRCRATRTCPKIVETFGSSEFYHLRASPMLVGTRADRDIPLPDNVRRYFFPGVSHGGGMGGFDASVAPNPCCEFPSNPNPSSDTLRAVQAALVEWVMKDVAPPPSKYPRLDKGELVPPTRLAMGFPSVSGMPTPDGILNPFYLYDLGRAFHYNDLSGVAEPASIRQVLPTLVPRVDADGNETSGVRSVLHQVPLGTYTGWNTNVGGFDKGRIRTNTGSFFAFARTKDERIKAGDPRLSLEERYGTHAGYVERVRAAAASLVRERFLLPDDAERLIRQAELGNVLR